MESRKIQRSGTTNYLYLPASWCREHKITTDSTVYLNRASNGDLQVTPKKTESNLSSLKIALPDNSPEVINKMLIASYINPVKEFRLDLKMPISSDQVLQHKKILGGLELVDFDENSISCQTSLALSDPDSLLQGMIKKVLSIIKLMKKEKDHELIKRYEEEVDKSNLLIHKSIIAGLMYRKESKLRHIDLFYIGSISRLLEQCADILITVDDPELVDTVERMLNSLLALVPSVTYAGVISFVKELGKLQNIKVKDLETYKQKRVYSLLGHIAEILCDWVVTEEVDKAK
jgi:phosphate uptake regulator